MDEANGTVPDGFARHAIFYKLAVALFDAWLAGKGE